MGILNKATTDIMCKFTQSLWGGYSRLPKHSLDMSGEGYRGTASTRHRIRQATLVKVLGNHPPPLQKRRVYHCPTTSLYLLCIWQLDRLG